MDSSDLANSATTSVDSFCRSSSRVFCAFNAAAAPSSAGAPWSPHGCSTAPHSGQGVLSFSCLRSCSYLATIISSVRLSSSCLRIFISFLTWPSSSSWRFWNSDLDFSVPATPFVAAVRFPVHALSSAASSFMVSKSVRCFSIVPFSFSKSSRVLPANNDFNSVAVFKLRARRSFKFFSIFVRSRSASPSCWDKAAKFLRALLWVSCNFL